MSVPNCEIQCWMFLSNKHLDRVNIIFRLMTILTSGGPEDWALWLHSFLSWLSLESRFDCKRSALLLSYLAIIPWTYELLLGYHPPPTPPPTAMVRESQATRVEGREGYSLSLPSLSPHYPPHAVEPGHLASFFPCRILITKFYKEYQLYGTKQESSCRQPIGLVMLSKIILKLPDFDCF